MGSNPQPVAFTVTLTVTGSLREIYSLNALISGTPSSNRKSHFVIMSHSAFIDISRKATS